MKLIMKIELEVDENFGEDPEEKEWLFKDVLKESDLFLHSNEVGDIVGLVKVIELKDS